MRLTLTIGLFTVFTTGTVAVISTSRLAYDRAESRSVLAIRGVEDLVADRLHRTQSAVESVAGRAVASTETVASEPVLTRALRAEGETLGEAYVADAFGHVIASSQADAPASIINTPVFQEVRQGRGGFIGIAAGSDTPEELWFARASVTGGGVPVVVVAKVNTDFLDDVLSQASDEMRGGLAAIMEGPTTVAYDGPMEPSSATFTWRPSSDFAGSVVLRGPRGVRLGGQYRDIQGLEGLAWRVIVTPPQGTVLDDSIRAVTPSLVALMLGGAIAVVTVLYLSRRLVRPLRELETAALDAAAGGIVQPLSADRDDEIGSLSQAFNGIALRLNALHDLSQLLARATRQDEVLDAILSAMRHIVGPGAAAIYLLDATGARLEPAATRGIDLAGAQVIELSDNDLVRRVLRAGSPEEIELGATAESILPGLDGAHPRMVAAPLVSSTGPIGIVAVLRDTAEEMTEAEREMVKTFSAQAAVAVTTSRLFVEERDSRHVSESLRRVAEQLVQPGGLSRSLPIVEETIRDVLHAPFSRVLVVDGPAVGMSAVPDDSDDARLLGVGLRFIGSSAASDPVVVERGRDEVCDSLMVEFDSERLMFVPVGMEGDHGAVVVIALQYGQQMARDIKIARAIADEISLALENAYLYERAVARAVNLETIFRISQAVGSSLQVNVVLNRVLDVVAKILSADAVALLSYDPRRRTLSTAMARGQIPVSILHLELEPGQDVPGHVFTSGEPVAMRDLQSGASGVVGDAARGGLGSLLAVPLLARGRSIGVLMVFSSQQGAFTDEDMSVLRTFASQAALALDTARLYSREHQVASVLQQSILPDALPEMQGIDAASVYEPGGGDAEIGGDYYDLFRAGDGSVWIAIADVCGKGIVAATKTSMIKYTVRALVAAGLAPSGVLAEVNKMVAEAGDPSDIVTALVARYDAAAGTLQWCNGGHPPAFVRHPSGDLTSLSATGPLLGALAGATYEQESVEFVAGSMVMLYTDGVTEARHGNTFFGEDRVRDVLTQATDARDAAYGLVDAVKGYSHAALRDDVAVLVVRATDKSETGPGL